MNTAMIDSCEKRIASDCHEYGSHGLRMPKPSRPGMGSRLRIRAITSMKPKYARAAKKVTFDCVTQEALPGTRNGAATSSAHRAVPSGPASDTNESQIRLRIAEWSMYTAPPGSP